MPSVQVEEFARLLVQYVRDRAIQKCDMNLRPGTNNAIAKRWKIAAESGNPVDIAQMIIPDCVDAAICALLRAIDQGALRLMYCAADGSKIDLSKESSGEFVGWYMGTGDSWRIVYTGERFFDDLSDLQ